MNYEENCSKSQISLCRVLMIIVELLRQLKSKSSSFMSPEVLVPNAHREFSL